MVGGSQVLVCPICQKEHDWVADLDRCAACASTKLVRSLGDTRCLDCGATSDTASDSPDGSPQSGTQGSGSPRGGSQGGGLERPAPGPLAADVSAALRKVFGPPSP